jgi:hypothetical protein
MTKQSLADPHARIEAAEVQGVEFAEDGSRLLLRLLDRTGRPATVSLPLASLNTVLSAVLPTARAPAAGGQVHALDSWTLRHSEYGLLLTLHVADGGRVTFAVQPWQIAAIASLVGEGGNPARRRPN